MKEVPLLPEIELYISQKGSSVFFMKDKQKILKEYGLTNEDFNEIVEFYVELLRIDPKREKQRQLVRILYVYLQKRIAEEQKHLKNEITRLEILKSKF